MLPSILPLSASKMLKAASRKPEVKKRCGPFGDRVATSLVSGSTAPAGISGAAAVNKATDIPITQFCTVLLLISHPSCPNQKRHDAGISAARGRRQDDPTWCLKVTAPP